MSPNQFLFGILNFVLTGRIIQKLKLTLCEFLRIHRLVLMSASKFKLMLFIPLRVIGVVRRGTLQLLTQL